MRSVPTQCSAVGNNGWRGGVVAWWRGGVMVRRWRGDGGRCRMAVRGGCWGTGGARQRGRGARRSRWPGWLNANPGAARRGLLANRSASAACRGAGVSNRRRERGRRSEAPAALTRPAEVRQCGSGAWRARGTIWQQESPFFPPLAFRQQTGGQEMELALPPIADASAIRWGEVLVRLKTFVDVPLYVTRWPSLLRYWQKSDTEYGRFVAVGIDDH